MGSKVPLMSHLPSWGFWSWTTRKEALMVASKCVSSNCNLYHSSTNSNLDIEQVVMRVTRLSALWSSPRSKKHGCAVLDRPQPTKWRSWCRAKRSCDIS